MTGCTCALARENLDLRRALGALKVMSLQGDYHGIRDELDLYVVDLVGGEPVISPLRRPVRAAGGA